MKRKIAVIGALAIIVSLSLALLLTGAVGSEGHAAPTVRVIALERQNLEQSISLAGTVHSARSTEIHSTLHFPVETVNVRVGDRVSEGDVLAVLDMSSLEMDARQLQASLSASQAAAGQNLTAARNALETARRNIETGNDPALMSARFGVSNAQLAVAAAEAQLTSAGAALHNARQDLRDYRSDRRLWGYDQYEDFDPVLSQLRNTVTAAESALRSAQSNLEAATENLRSAEESYLAAQVLSADMLAAHQDMVASAQASTNFGDMQIAIQSLQSELEKAEILSPVYGTVTAVIAEEGAPGAGLLFVIQDTESLIVKTHIREFDLAFVNLGDRVNIRADATGSTVFAGTLTRIAPTSTQMAYGGGQHSTYAEFESEVAVASDGRLRIGMNTRLSITTQQRYNVFVVPYQAVATNAYGKSIIYIAIPGEGGSYITQTVPVTTGIEANGYIEIFAEGLAEGILVVRNPLGIQAGMLVTPQYS